MKHRRDQRISELIRQTATDFFHQNPHYALNITSAIMPDRRHIILRYVPSQPSLSIDKVEEIHQHLISHQGALVHFLAKQTQLKRLPRIQLQLDIDLWQNVHY